METRPHVLIAGVSVRALAESASRVGYRVSAVDAFGDLDQPRGVQTIALPRDIGIRYTACAAARVAAGIACDAVVYTGSFENHLGAVALLGAPFGTRGRELWGNPPSVLARVRDPFTLFPALARRGFATPLVRSIASSRAEPRELRGVRWLVKPRASGGGHGIKRWNSRDPLAGRAYLEQEILGMSGSIVFVADGQRAVLLGISRQLVGDPALGASGFRYCGSILAGAGDAEFGASGALMTPATRLAAAITEEFSLVGLNGVDFISQGETLFPIEVNPRYSASMELVERAHGLSVFDAHVRACRGQLPAFDLSADAGSAVTGKAIAYARRAITMGDTRAWLDDPSVRDIPHPGERIRRGRPVCTVFARATDAAACRVALVRRAARVYREIEARGRRIA